MYIIIIEYYYNIISLHKLSTQRHICIHEIYLYIDTKITTIMLYINKSTGYISIQTAHIKIYIYTLYKRYIYIQAEK